MDTFGSRLKKLRIERNLGQKEIGAVLGVSDSSIRKYEADDRTPTPEAIKKLAEFFGVTTDYLLANDIEQAKKEINNAISDDPELIEFWSELQQRDDLKILCKQTKSLSPTTIKRIIKYIKMVEDEEAQED